MISAVVAILCGILMLAEQLPAAAAQVVTFLKPHKTVIGVVALVVGILGIKSVTGIALVVAGLMLGRQTLASIPYIGGSLSQAGQELEKFNVVIGLIVLILGIMGLLHAF